MASIRGIPSLTRPQPAATSRQLMLARDASWAFKVLRFLEHAAGPVHGGGRSRHDLCLTGFQIGFARAIPVTQRGSDSTPHADRHNASDMRKPCRSTPRHCRDARTGWHLSEPVRSAEFSAGHKPVWLEAQTAACHRLRRHKPRPGGKP